MQIRPVFANKSSLMQHPETVSANPLRWTRGLRGTAQTPRPESAAGRIPRYRSLSAFLNMSAAIVGMTSLLLMVQISGVASMAYEVQRLEDSRLYWQEANYRAETDIARLQSLERIEEEATARLKMVPAKDTVPVLLPGPVQARTSSLESSRNVPNKARGTAPWWQELADLVGQIRGGP